MLNINKKISKLHVENFRGLNNLTIDSFSTINIFVGANNSGKTSILEAIKLMSAPRDIGLLITLALQRVQIAKELKTNNLVRYMTSLFQRDKDEESQKYYGIKLQLTYDGHDYEYEADGDVGIIVNTSGESRDSLDIAIKTKKDQGNINYAQKRLISGSSDDISAKEKPTFTSLYLTSSTNYYSSCVKLLSNYIIEEGKSDILRILRSFDSHIEDISIVGTDIYLYSSFSGSMPLFSYGLGMQKALLLTALIANCKNGIVLIDEIDNAIHVSAFEDVFKWFLAACEKNNVQAFITTHSLEAVDAILNAAHESHLEDSLRVITLRKSPIDNMSKCKVRTGEEAFYDRETFRMELRV